MKKILLFEKSEFGMKNLGFLDFITCTFLCADHFYLLNFAVRVVSETRIKYADVFYGKSITHRKSTQLLESPQHQVFWFSYKIYVSPAWQVAFLGHIFGPKLCRQPSKKIGDHSKQNTYLVIIGFRLRSKNIGNTKLLKIS